MAEQAPSLEDRLSNYLHGDAEPAAEEVVEEAPETEAEPVTEAAGEEVEEEAKEETTEEAEQPDEVEVSNISELAEHLGLEIADLYALEVPGTDPDGNKMSVSLGELKDGFQSSKMYAKEQAKLQQERERVAQTLQQAEQKTQQELGIAQSLIQTAEKALLGDIESTDWPSLLDEDPGKYAAQRQVLMERQSLLKDAKEQVVQMQQAAQREHAQKQQEEIDSLKAKEQAALLEAFPKWENAEVAAAEWAEMAQTAIDVGFKPGEVENILDHRAYRLLKLAAEGAKAMQKTDVAKKRVLKIGKKILKPGAKAAKEDAAQDHVRSLRAKLKKSGNPKDALELIKLGL